MRELDKKKIEDLADIIIPPGNNGEPSGSQSRAGDYILTRLEKQEEKTELYEFLLKLSDIPELSEPSLQIEERGSPALFHSLVELVYEAYYGDPVIVQKLELPRPPQPKGHEMKPFDKSLLQSVIERSKRA